MGWGLTGTAGWLRMFELRFGVLNDLERPQQQPLAAVCPSLLKEGSHFYPMWRRPVACTALNESLRSRLMSRKSVSSHNAIHRQVPEGSHKNLFLGLFPFHHSQFLYALTDLEDDVTQHE